jgi:hypothetical protein
MLDPLPRPSASSGDGTSDRATAGGKIALATQWQREREKLLAVVAKSREPAIDKTHAHKRTAPATPSSADRANRLYQRSAKKFLKQPAITYVSTVSVIPITKLQLIPEQDTDEGEDNDAKLLDREVLPEESEEATVVPPAGQEETEDTGETAVVESNLPQLENLVCLPSMFDRETVVNDPHFVCTAAHLCRSVGDQTSMMSICINCN